MGQDTFPEDSVGLERRDRDENQQTAAYGRQKGQRAKAKTVGRDPGKVLGGSRRHGSGAPRCEDTEGPRGRGL